MLGLSLIAKFLFTKIDPRRVITCSRGSPEVSTGSYPFKVWEKVEKNMCPSPLIIRFFLKIREISEGTSYQMVRLVFRHFAADERLARPYRNEPSPGIPLTLPFSGIFRGFSACSNLRSYLKPLSRSRSVAGVCVCVQVCACVRVKKHWKTYRKTEKCVWYRCVLCGVARWEKAKKHKK